MLVVIVLNTMRYGSVRARTMEEPALSHGGMDPSTEPLGTRARLREPVDPGEGIDGFEAMRIEACYVKDQG